MAYAPTAFVAGSTLASQTMRDNDDALRVYLHNGVAAGDLDPTDWIDTRHVQPPKMMVKRNVQTGVTGLAGGMSYRPFERFSFTTYTATGMSRQATVELWEEVPGMAMTLPLAGNATVIYHWHATAFVGPDVTDPSGAATPVIQNPERRVYLAPYFMLFDEDLTASKVDTKSLVEIRQNIDGFRPLSATDHRGGAHLPYHWTGYGQRSGVMIKSFTGTINKPNVIHVGLAHWSLVQRAMLLNWSVSVEVYYT